MASVPNPTKQLETSTVVKHEIAHGVGINNFVSTNPVSNFGLNNFALDQEKVTGNLETVVLGNF
jgi:hypothetical protein